MSKKPGFVPPPPPKEPNNNEQALSLNALRLMDESKIQGLLFEAIRECNIPTIKNILQINRSLVTAKMFGFEGADVYEVIKNSKTHRCYKYTGVERDGFFYPLHVAAEAGHKRLTFLLVKAGADVNAVDYRGDIAESKCNGDALHAFYELRGLVYEERERFEGRLDRDGRRTGQGMIHLKPEGYLSTEKLLYRGGFKFDMYHGHGTLYWPGTNTLRYVGRFSKGLRHGRGLEFDKNGQKIYQGSFHHDVRDGRGEEYTEGQITYRGEYAKGAKHGFGVAIFGPNHRYVGRFEDNAMAGLGIYCHPNGDRFEGLFYNNKLDGPGSYYQKDPATGKVTAIHALWQKGKKVKDLGIPFVPKSVDLPDDRSENLLSAMAADEDKILRDIERLESSDGAPTTIAGTRKYSAKLPKNNLSDWKVNVGKYCRLTAAEALSLGIESPKDFGFSDTTDNTGEELHEEDGDATEDMMNEVNGVDFIDFTALFVAYIYVNSASKVFEGRIASTHISESVPDFEAVYHVVIDAVETYNDTWVHQYQLQEERLEREQGIKRSTSDTNLDEASDGKLDFSKRKVFMSEREQRDEELRRQRAALAAKKGQGQLDIEVEKQIQALSYQALEEELMKLLSDETLQSEGQQASKPSPDTEKKPKGGSSTPKPHSKLKLIEETSSKVDSIAYVEVPSANDFASELLHIIRLSRSIMM